MTFIEDVLKQILSDDPDVAALVGSRIYPGVMPQSTNYPAIAYRVTDVDREPVLDLKTTTPPRTTVVFFSVAKDVVAGVSPRRMAALVDRAVRHALQGFKNAVVVSSVSPPTSVSVHGIFFVTASDTFEDRTKTFQAASVFDVHHSEEVPD